MNGGISLGYLLVLSGSLLNYAADQGRLEPSLSLLFAEGGGVEIRSSLSGVHSPAFFRSKTMHSNGSRSSDSRRSSGEEDYVKDTDTEASFATLGSAPSSAENSPKNGMYQKKSSHQKILEQGRNLQEPINKLVACVSGLDEHQRQEAGDQLVRNVIAQVVALSATQGDIRKIAPILDEQLDAQLKAEITQVDTKDCCECVIL